MNGLNTSNLALGAVMARDLGGPEQLRVGLAAGMMPPNNLLGVVLLKGLTDELVAARSRSSVAEQAGQALRSEIVLDLPDEAEGMRLGIANATDVSFQKTAGSEGTSVDATTGIVSLPVAGDNITVAVNFKGVTRSLVIKRATVPEEATERAGNGQRAAARASVGERRPTSIGSRAGESTGGSERAAAIASETPAITQQVAAGPADVVKQATAAYPGMTAEDASARRRGK